MIYKRIVTDDDEIIMSNSDYMFKISFH